MGLSSSLAPTCSKLSRSQFFPKGLWRRLAVLTGEDFHPEHPQKVTLALPENQAITLLLDLHDSLSRSIYYFGTHEPDTTAFLRRKFKDPRLRVVFDIGSNIGYYAITAAVMLRARGRVEAFEPVPWIFDSLKANGQLNHLTNLRSHRLAIGRENRSATLFLPHGHRAWSSNATLLPELAKIFNRLFSPPGTVIDSLNVSLRSLDSLIDEEGLESPDLIRMDIEGAEHAALQGMERTLQKCSPDLVFEALPEGLDPLRGYLQELGYETYLIGPGGRLRKSALIWNPRANRDWYAAKGQKAV